MSYVAYRSRAYPEGVVGLVEAETGALSPVLRSGGDPVRDLFEVIEEWETLGQEGETGANGDRSEERLEDVEVLAPLSGRDVLCVGKNYREHAAEFHGSGYDNDKDATPEQPIIFTKRATSIVPNGHPIYPHPKATTMLDYEGELAIIVGKAGLGIAKEGAWDYVWGATIVNDVTARDRQRDHKQFYIGKSFDTFCPMGPYAVHKSKLDFANMRVETRVNGQLRQSAPITDLIFDIPTIIETCSLGTTLQPGDVIATGTPYGVGISSGSFLQPGDVVEVSVTGLGTLRNQVADGAVELAPCRLPSQR